MIQKVTVYYLMIFGTGIPYLPKYKVTLIFIGPCIIVIVEE